MKKISLLILMLILMLYVSGCRNSTIVTGTPKKLPTQKNKNEINSVSSSPISIKPFDANQIWVSSKDELENLISKNIASGKDTSVYVNFKISEDELNNIVVNASSTSEYAGYISKYEYGIRNNEIEVHFIYKGGSQHFITQINAVNSKAENVVRSLIKKGMNDYQKEIVLHDYIVNNVKYDMNDYQKGSVPDDAYTSYGALVNGTAVCEGYAEAANKLFTCAGLDSRIVTGFANGEPHAWNIVSIFKKYYHVDTTFDDPAYTGADSNLISDTAVDYSYFNLSDAQIEVNHSWNRERYPVCLSTYANYFVINGLIADNKSKFYNIIKSQLLRKDKVILCRTNVYDVNNYSINTVFQVINDNPDIRKYINLKKEVSYNYDPKTKVMEIYIDYI